MFKLLYMHNVHDINHVFTNEHKGFKTQDYTHDVLTPPHGLKHVYDLSVYMVTCMS